MATARIQYLAPGPIRPSLHYDFQALPRLKPHVRKLRDGTFESSGLGYEDFQSAQVIRRRGGHRKKATPAWALDERLASVIVAFLETRASCGRGMLNTSDTLSERMTRAKTKLHKMKPRQESILDSLCRELVTIKDPDRRRKLAREMPPGHRADVN